MEGRGRGRRAERSERSENGRVDVEWSEVRGVGLGVSCLRARETCRPGPCGGRRRSCRRHQLARDDGRQSEGPGHREPGARTERHSRRGGARQEGMQPAIRSRVVDRQRYGLTRIRGKNGRTGWRVEGNTRSLPMGAGNDTGLLNQKRGFHPVVCIRSRMWRGSGRSARLNRRRIRWAIIFTAFKVRRISRATSGKSSCCTK
jgi:hypothetical protein